jgi:hypothetical protein
MKAEQLPDENYRASIYAYGIELFGTSEAFAKWMNCDILAIGCKPKDLDLPSLLDELYRIQSETY